MRVPLTSASCSVNPVGIAPATASWVATSRNARANRFMSARFLRHNLQPPRGLRRVELVIVWHTDFLFFFWLVAYAFRGGFNQLGNGVRLRHINRVAARDLDDGRTCTL